jgi:hypothetical protein
MWPFIFLFLAVSATSPCQCTFQFCSCCTRDLCLQLEPDVRSMLVRARLYLGEQEIIKSDISVSEPRMCHSFLFTTYCVSIEQLHVRWLVVEGCPRVTVSGLISLDFPFSCFEFKATDLLW